LEESICLEGGGVKLKRYTLGRRIKEGDTISLHNCGLCGRLDAGGLIRR
jgi:hypothetical protein